MTWVYAALSKEAGRRGGPDALRCFSRGQGVIIGAAVTGAGVAGPLLYNKWCACRAAADPAPQTTAKPAPGESADA
ncbi:MULTISPECIES: hypothetical protein [Streptomyces]|uniref:Uncharacterized protein n=1 Tax=Streptomyces virginiae TaxID=1961 RepID=A0ABZ1TQZ1_STRVG|nr:hypothetical protein [Streptomyces virginiae]